MQCPNCKTAVEDGALFCGNCGKQIASLYGRGSAPTEISNSQQPGFQGPPSSIPAQPNPISAFPGQPNPISAFPGQANPISPFPPSTMGSYEQAPPGAATAPTQRAYYGGATPSTPQRSIFDETREPATPDPIGLPSRPSRRPRPASKGIIFLSIIVILCLVGITAGAIVLIQGNGQQTNGRIVTPVNRTQTQVATGNAGQGNVLFLDSTGQTGTTDSVKITATGLDTPPTGSHYMAWIIDIENEGSLLLGELKPDGQGLALSASLEENLIGAGNKLEVTQETTQRPIRPNGTVVLAATFPPDAFMHIRHLLFSFPTVPNQVSLLGGTLQEIGQLHEQGELLKNNRSNQEAVRCIAHNIIYLLEGKDAPDGHPLPAFCEGPGIGPVGDGQGLLGKNGYITLAANHANFAATADDAQKDRFIVPFAQHVQVAMDNLNGWLATIKDDAHKLLDDPGDTITINDIHALADIALNGRDIDDNGVIDPVTGEAGAITAYQQGQLMAQLDLQKPASNEG